MVDWTRPIQTVDGKPARLLCDDFKAMFGRQYLVGVTYEKGIEVARSFKADGTDDNDIKQIINVPGAKVKRTVWINVYPEVTAAVGSIYSSKTWADYFSFPKRLACIPVEIEYHEGEGL